jgi:hypothetical protein
MVVARGYCKHLVQPYGGGPRRECKNRAAPGSDYCARHVNHPDRRVEATKASLNDFVDAAIRGLGRIVQAGADNDDVKDADVIKAAIAILDRTGNGPTSTVTLQDSDDRLNQIITARRRALDDSEA